MRCRNRARIQKHGNAGFLHLLLCEFPELRCYFGQDLVLRMDQRDDHIVFAEIVVKAGAAANEFIDFSGYFCAAETRSHDDKAEMPPAEVGISGGFRELRLYGDMLAKDNGNSQYL